MPKRLDMPPIASLVIPESPDRLYADSATRNAPHIVELVHQYAPDNGQALEIASGTGQHIVELARATPQLIWQPSDIDDARLRSIAAHVEEAALDNIASPALLDATTTGWAKDHVGQDLILLVNLLHLISTDEAQTLITEAARCLTPGGQLIIYGPFMRGDELTSEGDAEFHTSLQTTDLAIGYKSDFDVTDWGIETGLTLVDVVEMPANNLSIIWHK